MERSALYGIIAEFTDADALLRGVQRARSAGYSRLDAFTPFPVDGLADALACHTRPVARTVLCGGILGALSGYALQYYCAAIGYPLNVAGRPLNSVPAFIPVTFELTILFAALAAFIGALVLNRLPRLAHPLFNVEAFEAASQDGFFLCVEEDDERFDIDETTAFLKSVGARMVHEVPLDPGPRDRV